MAANARTAAKKRTSPKPKAADIDADFKPVRLTAKLDTEADRVVLFYVDDEPYSIPKKIGREYGLRYLDDVASSGDAVATVNLMKDVLGEDGYEALMGCEGLEDDDLNAIMDRLRDGALGATENDGGRRGKGR